MRISVHYFIPTRPIFFSTHPLPRRLIDGVHLTEIGVVGTNINNSSKNQIPIERMASMTVTQKLVVMGVLLLGVSNVFVSRNLLLPFGGLESLACGPSSDSTSAATANSCYSYANKDECRRIQCLTWSQSWAAGVSAVDKDLWQTLNCREKLRVRPLEKAVTEESPACRAYTPDLRNASNTRLLQLRNKYKGGKCVLMGNGPSLNRMRWDWQDNVDVIMGTNKIFLGLERYNLSSAGKFKLYGSCNPLVIEQSADEVWSFGKGVDKFLANRPATYPCKAATEQNFHFIRSGGRAPFSRDITKSINEGWTVTYWSLQVLHWVGCHTVYLIGVDHNFDQKGPPNQKQKMTHDDPNHFDPSYFKNHDWHLADLANSERFYRIANEFFNKTGRHIYDATDDGNCDIFPKVDWKAALYTKD